jgi:hypothetical protein
MHSTTEQLIKLLITNMATINEITIWKTMSCQQWQAGSHTTTKLFHQSSLPPAESDMSGEIWQSQNSHLDRDSMLCQAQDLFKWIAEVLLVILTWVWGLWTPWLQRITQFGEWYFFFKTDKTLAKTQVWELENVLRNDVLKLPSHPVACDFQWNWHSGRKEDSVS